MKIFICSSMSFSKEIIKIEKEVKKMGHEVDIPCDTEEFVSNPGMTTDNHEENYKWCLEKDIIRKCFQSISESDAILVLNYPKNGINGHIGASVLMEIGLAYWLNKKIFLLYPPPPPQEVKSSHEVLIMQPVILNGELDKISNSEVI